MKKKMFIGLFMLVFVALALCGCTGLKTDEERLVGLWIGWRMEGGEGIYCVYDFHKDGTYSLVSGENIGRWWIEDGLLRLSLGNYEDLGKYEYWFEEDGNELRLRKPGSNVTTYLGRNSYD